MPGESKRDKPFTNGRRDEAKKAEVLPKPPVAATVTHLSEQGLEFISREEGLRTVPYNDAKGYATVGVGHLLHYSGVTSVDLHKFANYDGKNKPFTSADAIRLLKVDASRFEHAVLTAVKVPITQNQFDALCSFAFNVGENGMATSEAVRALNAGHPEQVPALLHHWDDKGLLTGRRTREGDLFAHGKYR